MRWDPSTCLVSLLGQRGLHLSFVMGLGSLWHVFTLSLFFGRPGVARLWALLDASSCAPPSKSAQRMHRMTFCLSLLRLSLARVSLFSSAGSASPGAQHGLRGAPGPAVAVRVGAGCVACNSQSSKGWAGV